MLQVIYASAASQNMTSDMLLCILDKARVKNERLNVTGFLLYDDGSFLQVLEGPDSSIEEILGAIMQDDRHGNVRILSNKIIYEREFGDWAMAYAIEEGRAPDCEGFLDYSSTREAFSVDSSEVSQILAMFQEGLLRQADHKESHSGEHFTVTVSARDGTTNSRQAKFLLDFGRALALTIPDAQVGVSVGDGNTVNFNLRRDMEKGEVELF